MTGDDSIDPHKLNALIAEAKASGGSELANYQLFVIKLCDALGLPPPAMAKEETALNDYVFERRITFKHADGSSTGGRIDCYKRNCFVLEAKQSPKRRRKAQDAKQLALLPEAQAAPKLIARKGWDQIMLAARRQAEDYARALPVDHGYPPFLLIVDVGHVIEVYADFSGQGKNYAHFPDRQSYRIAMDDLRDTKVRERLSAIWREPHSLDPARRSAEVTRDIADRLARVAASLEARKHDPKDVAEFLMRCLFTMFAEDIGLIKDKAFEKLLLQLKGTPRHFVPSLESLWSVMNTGGYSPHFNVTLKKFNGGLFRNCRALPLEPDEINELHIAATKDWKDVEPAIFGTLLERALDAHERSKLGAHYTPRTYVERLVIPAVIEPLRADWQDVQAHASDLVNREEDNKALEAVRRFHRKLCTTHVLDPACGTGNFLYVSLELMKKLEGEVLKVMSDLGGEPDRYRDYPEEARGVLKGQRLARTKGRFTVEPHQFYGLEINPRAVPIADLVLWIGYLKWQLRTGGLDAIQEPVLDEYETIAHQDAIIAYDKQELLCDERGRPLSRWDGVTKKLHPITGEEIPDPDATVPLYKYVNPRPAPWPEAEFIVGNPPFIAGKDMRQELGDGYAEACWAARPHMPGGADFVMHFWDEAATRLLRKGTAREPNPLRRFGFITTNSVTQTFSRRVIERHMTAKEPLSLVYAVPDHPWLKAADKAAVRISMTVAEKGDRQGVLAEVVSEAELDTDTPKVGLSKREGKIRAGLTIGADIASTRALLGNELVSSPGVKLHGAGFIVTPQQASALGLGKVPGLDKHILNYCNGRDIAQRPRGAMVIDLFPLDVDAVRAKFPAVYQHILHTVKPERDQNNRASYRENWWTFGEPRKDMRPALEGLPRYITTIETAKHRFFQFLDASIRPDNMLVNVGLPSAEHLAVLSSRLHVAWALASGGWLGMGNDPRYSKTRTFDPFPFPDLEGREALKDRLRELGERLDSFRKERLAQHDFLTMTGLYNALERLREIESDTAQPPLTGSERDVHQAGLVSVLKEIHDDIDRAALSAYGWEDLIPALVGKPGATLPSDHKSDAQEAAEETLLGRLVALNHARAEEEKRGVVRWLRPDYQKAKLGIKVAKPVSGELDLEIAEGEAKPKWPADGLEQIRVVRDLLARAEGPVASSVIASVFDGRNTAQRKERVARVLATLAATGAARTEGVSGEARYFVPK